MAVTRNSGSGFQDGGSVTSSSWSHDVTTANCVLIVEVRVRSAQSCTGVTHNGVAMTQIGSYYQANTGSNRISTIWALTNPATGSKTITASYSASTAQPNGNSIAYSGADVSTSTSWKDATSTVNAGTPSSSPQSIPITTTTDNCRLLAFFQATGGTFTVASGTNNQTTGSGVNYVLDSTAVKSPAGSYSLDLTYTGSPTIVAWFVVAITPQATVASSALWRMS